MGWHAGVKGEETVTFAWSSKGWTDRELGLAWLERNFAKYTKDMQVLPKRPPGSADYYSANGEPHILILDGHGSHLTWEFSDFCLKRNIHPVCRPSHSIHILQPLVGPSVPLSRQFSDQLGEWVRKGGYAIWKGQFHR